MMVFDLKSIPLCSQTALAEVKKAAEAAGAIKVTWVGLCHVWYIYPTVLGP